jgi:S1-C subfamily serine protease
MARTAEWKAFHYTVRVRNLSCSGLGVGSGFLVDSRTLVTNRHVVQDANRLSVSTWDGHHLAVSAESVATLADLAVIRLTEGSHRVAPFGGDDPVVGAPVYAVGYPRGGRITAEAGEVLGYTDGPALGNTGEVIEVSARVQPGNSGGPLVDRSGAVVGVVYAIDRRSGHGLAVPLTMLRTLLERDAFQEQVRSPGC